MTNKDPDKLYEVHSIIDSREVEDTRMKRKKKGPPIMITQYLVHWKNFGPHEDSWEPEDGLSCDDMIAQFLTKQKADRRLLRQNDTLRLQVGSPAVAAFTRSHSDAARRAGRSVQEALPIPSSKRKTVNLRRALSLSNLPNEPLMSSGSPTSNNSNNNNNSNTTGPRSYTETPSNLAVPDGSPISDGVTSEVPGSTPLDADLEHNRDEPSHHGMIVSTTLRNFPLWTIP